MRGPDERFVNHGFIHSLKYWNGNQHKSINHNYNKIVKSVWLSTVLISALLESVIGRHVSCLQLDSMRHHILGLKPLFFTASEKTLRISLATMNVAPGYFNRKIKEKQNQKKPPSCLILHLLVVFTWQLEILVVPTIFEMLPSLSH